MLSYNKPMPHRKSFLTFFFFISLFGLLAFTHLAYAGEASEKSYTEFWSIGCQDVVSCIDLFIDAALVLAFPIAVIFIVFSGFKFVTAQGNPSEITKARQALVWTLLGLALVIGAKALSAAFQQFFIQGS